MSLVNICARARAAEAEVLIFLFNVLDANQLIPPPLFHFANGMDSSAPYSSWNGLNFSAHVIGRIHQPFSISQRAGFLRLCLFQFAMGWIHPPIFNLAMGWIPPPIFYFAKAVP